VSAKCLVSKKRDAENDLVWCGRNTEHSSGSDISNHSTDWQENEVLSANHDFQFWSYHKKSELLYSMGQDL
jgi:hypothetical protein